MNNNSSSSLLASNLTSISLVALQNLLLTTTTTSPASFGHHPPQDPSQFIQPSLNQDDSLDYSPDYQAAAAAGSSPAQSNSSAPGLDDMSRELWQMLIETHTVDMPPPSQVHHVQILAVAGLYFILFMVGICGNTSVLTILSHLNQSLKKAKLSRENTFIYLMALSIVDFCVILSLPIAISDMLLGHWIFGSAICKLYWTLESTGKIMSTFILAAMSFDRYIGVCHPTKTQWRTRRSSFLILFMLVIAALGLLSPLTYHANSKIIKQSNPIPDGHGRFVRFTTSKCRVFTMEDVTFIAFTWYIFIVGHLIPALLIGYFYAGMLWTIRVHQRNSMTTSRIKIRRVVLYTLAVCGFYFACWTPYWAGNILYVQLVQEGTTDNFVYLMYVIHALPFINSSLNWIFYALLNTQLRRTQQKVNSATKTNGSFVMGRTMNLSCNHLALSGGGGAGGGGASGVETVIATGGGVGVGGGNNNYERSSSPKCSTRRLARNGVSSKSMKVVSSSSSSSSSSSTFNHHIQRQQQQQQSSPPYFHRQQRSTVGPEGGGNFQEPEGGGNSPPAAFIDGQQQDCVGSSSENLPLMFKNHHQQKIIADC